MVLLNLKKGEALLLFQMVNEDPDFDDRQTQEIYERLWDKLARMRLDNSEVKK